MIRKLVDHTMLLFEEFARVFVSWIEINFNDKRLLIKCKNDYTCVSSSLAEWSKALVLGTRPFGGVGLSPNAAKFHFFRVQVNSHG